MCACGTYETVLSVRKEIVRGRSVDGKSTSEVWRIPSLTVPRLSTKATVPFSSINIPTTAAAKPPT